jgi:hypothetical protein
MPWFKRPDGDLVTDENPVRRMIPYLMARRNESAIYHDEWVDLSRTRALAPRIQPRPPGQPGDHVPPDALRHQPRLLRVRPPGHGTASSPAARSSYQRKGVWLSFAAKRRGSRGMKSALVTGEDALLRRRAFGGLREEAHQGAHRRGAPDKVRTVEQGDEAGAGNAGPDLACAPLAALRFLDRLNLMPGR